MEKYYLDTLKTGMGECKMEMMTLNNGVEMPILGFGTYQVTDPGECEKSVINTVEAGYRLIDTAQAYGNEEAVGAGIRNCGVDRKELFVTTKVWFRCFEGSDCRASLEESMKKLGVDYLDKKCGRDHRETSSPYPGYQLPHLLPQETGGD